MCPYILQLYSIGGLLLVPKFRIIGDKAELTSALQTKANTCSKRFEVQFPIAMIPNIQQLAASSLN